MIKKESIETLKLVKEEKVLSVACDICGKKVVSNNAEKYFFHVTTHHYDRGNDSADSYRDYQLCSLECLKTHLSNYVINNERHTAEYEIISLKKMEF